MTSYYAVTHPLSKTVLLWYVINASHVVLHKILILAKFFCTGQKRCIAQVP